jgi:hypothetical protein
MSQLSNSDTYLNYSSVSPNPQSSDGLFYNRSTGATEVLVAGTSVATFDAQGPAPIVASPTRCQVFEDFIGNAFPSATGPLTTKETSAAGTMVLAVVEDADCGHFKMGFDATDEAQVGTLYTGNNRNIDPASNPVAIFRLNVQATPAAPDTLVFGLASDQADDADTIASHATFRITGANLTLLLESDNGVTDNDDKAPDQAHTLTANTMYEFKVDASDVANVLFYWRATVGGAWTQLTSGATAFSVHATTGLQPFIQWQKASGTGTKYILVDYVQVIFDRT